MSFHPESSNSGWCESAGSPLANFQSKQRSRVRQCCNCLSAIAICVGKTQQTAAAHAKRTNPPHLTIMHLTSNMLDPLERFDRDGRCIGHGRHSQSDLSSNRVSGTFPLLRRNMALANWKDLRSPSLCNCPMPVQCEPVQKTTTVLESWRAGRTTRGGAS